MRKNTKTISVLSAVLLATVLLAGCVDEISNNATVTSNPALSPTLSPAPSPTPSLIPSPTPTPEASPPVQKEIHQDLNVTPALAKLLDYSNITLDEITETIGFEVTLPSGYDREYDVLILLDTGKPMVPYIIKEFEIPKGSNIESVSVNLSNPVEIHNIFIEPAQPPVPSGGEDWWRNITPPPYTIDNETYASSEPYPGKGHDYKESVGIDLDTHRQVKHVVVYIYPIQYIPAENRIIAYKNASISISYWSYTQEEQL